jgi:hypothetical protein
MVSEESRPVCSALPASRTGPLTIPPSVLRDTQVTEAENAIKLTGDHDSEYNSLYSMMKGEKEKYGAGRKAVVGCLLEA